MAWFTFATAKGAKLLLPPPPEGAGAHAAARSAHTNNRGIATTRNVFIIPPKEIFSPSQTSKQRTRLGMYKPILTKCQQEIYEPYSTQPGPPPTKTR